MWQKLNREKNELKNLNRTVLWGFLFYLVSFFPKCTCRKCLQKKLNKTLHYAVYVSSPITVTGFAERIRFFPKVKTLFFLPIFPLWICGNEIYTYQEHCKEDRASSDSSPFWVVTGKSQSSFTHTKQQEIPHVFWKEDITWNKVQSRFFYHLFLLCPSCTSYHPLVLESLWTEYMRDLILSLVPQRLNKYAPSRRLLLISLLFPFFPWPEIQQLLQCDKFLSAVRALN